eukprot:9521595-Ditylum_brightwellii.AAC.1
MLGKKFVIGTCFKVRKKDASCHVCPMFNLYSLDMNKCDKLNKALHGEKYKDVTWKELHMNLAKEMLM